MLCYMRLFFVFTARKLLRKYSEASLNDFPVMIQASISISPKKNFQRLRIVTSTTLFAIAMNKWIVSEIFNLVMLCNYFFLIGKPTLNKYTYIKGRLL